MGRFGLARRDADGAWVVVERAAKELAEPLGRFAKGKSVGCRCRRHVRGNPKVSTSVCSGGCYQASLLERVEGNRLARAWLRAMQAHIDGDDVEL
ncbi:MAG: hypothetical protein ACHREM_04245 [Polyangiales bacterium]